MEEANKILNKAMEGIASAVTAHAFVTENFIKQLQRERQERNFQGPTRRVVFRNQLRRKPYSK